MFIFPTKRSPHLNTSLSPDWRATTARLINELDNQRKWRKRDEIGGHEQDIIEAEEEEEMKEKGGVAPIYHSDRWPCSWPWDLTASFSALISSLSSPDVHTFPPLWFPTSVVLRFLCSSWCFHPLSETFSDFLFSSHPFCIFSFLVPAPLFTKAAE